MHVCVCCRRESMFICVCPCTWICVLWACARVHRYACCRHVSVCISVYCGSMSVCAVLSYMFLDHPDTYMLLQKSHSCPGHESASVRMRNCAHEQLWPSRRLSLVQSHLAGESVAQWGLRPQLASSASWTGLYHKLSQRVCAVLHLPMEKLRHLVQELRGAVEMSEL